MRTGQVDAQIYLVRLTALSTSSSCRCWSVESPPSVEDVLFSSSNDLTIILVATFNESSNVNVDLRLERFLLELTSSFVYRWSSCSIRCSMLLSRLASGVAFGILFACNSIQVHESITVHYVTTAYGVVLKV